jgi:hypothetical protein
MLNEFTTTYMMILAAMLPSVSSWVAFSRAWRRPAAAAAESLDRRSRSAKRASHPLLLVLRETLR